MDKLIKAITKDGFIRIYTVVATETVKTAQSFHTLSPLASHALGRTLVAGLLMGATLKEQDASITLQIKGNGPLGTIVAVADSHGNVKGYAENPLYDNTNSNVGLGIGKGMLTVMKDLRLKEPYIGQVPLQTGEIGDDLAFYYFQSEQIPTVFSLGVVVDTDISISNAGGFLIQLMPGASDDLISRVERSLMGLPPLSELLSGGFSCLDIVKTVMLGFDIDSLDEFPVQYSCDCSLERVERAIISLGKQEIRKMIEEDNKAEVVCHFCDMTYNFDKNALSELQLQCLA